MIKEGEVKEAIRAMSTPGRDIEIRKTFKDGKGDPFRQAVLASYDGDIQDTIDLLGVCDHATEGSMALILSAVYAIRAKKLQILESAYIRSGLLNLAIKKMAMSDAYVEMSYQFQEAAQQLKIDPVNFKKGFKKSRT